MKKDISKLPIEIVKPPFFKKGCLMFIESSHYLRLSDKHYRCDLSCRKKCDKNEPQIKKENMERNFSRYAIKFHISEKIDDGSFMVRLTKDALIQIIEGEDWDSMIKSMDRLDDSVELMKSELKESNQILREDIENFENEFSQLNTVNPKLLLTSMVTGVLKSFSEPENETQIGRDLSILCKRIYINKKGKIKEILLEEWGWYIINLINKKIPGYLDSLKKNGVKIINDPNKKILSMELKEAVNYFSGDNFGDALNSFTIGSFYSMFSVFETFISPMVNGESTKKQKESVIKGFEQMNSPVFMALSKLMQVGNIKLRKKIERKNEKRIFK